MTKLCSLAVAFLLVASHVQEAQSGILDRLFGRKGESEDESSPPSGGGASPPEVSMNVPETVAYHGYPFEEHWVTTEDGYILYMIRIKSKNETVNQQKNRPVVLLQHGLASDSYWFITNPASVNLPYILADSGADVWLGNNRGTPYSVNHTYLNTNRRKFWDFSWDQMIEYDLPAMIYHMTNTTGQDQIYYIGHSQGTAIAFAAFSENKALASRIKHYIALAPVARVAHVTSGLRTLLPFQALIQASVNLLNHGAITQPQQLQAWISKTLCTKKLRAGCTNFFFFLIGEDISQLNQSRLPVYMSHNPSWLSVRTLVQWGQNVRSERFQKFDFGRFKNYRLYGQSTPPQYEPKNMDLPVAIVTGGHDNLADPTDVAWLRTQLSNITHDINVPYYNHGDMVIGLNAPTVVFPTIIDIVHGQQ